MLKYETDVSYTDLHNIASTACGMHEEENLENNRVVKTRRSGVCFEVSSRYAEKREL